MNGDLRIGIIGTDTSHSVAFTEILNDPHHPYHVPGGRVVAAYPGGSPDFALSISRVSSFARQLAETYGVAILEQPEEAAAACDAVLLLSADGRVHPKQLRQIASLKKPVFIDKPLALSTREAHSIFELAGTHGVPLMSTSSLRYAEALTSALEASGEQLPYGCDCFGPMLLEETQPGYFWYGIHSVEMLAAAFGTGCARVSVISSGDHDLLTAVWKDGRIGTVRGNRAGSHHFGIQLHFADGSVFANVSGHPKPFYASLLERVVPFFQTGQSPVSREETLAVIRLLEAANQSRSTGLTVEL